MFCQGTILGLFDARCVGGWEPGNHFVDHFTDYVFSIVNSHIYSRLDGKYVARLETAVKNWVHSFPEAKGLVIRLSRRYRETNKLSGIACVISDAIAFKMFGSMGPADRMHAISERPKLFVFIRSGVRSGLVGCVHYSAKEALGIIRGHFSNIDDQLMYPDKIPEGRDLYVGFTMEIVG
jgi:hypothetical protein